MALTAGEIRVYLVGQMSDDATWPDVFDGTESAETVTDTLVRDAICRLIAITATDTTASQVYYLDSGLVRDLPKTGVLFITQSTVSALETTGDPNQVYVALYTETVNLSTGVVTPTWGTPATLTQTNLDGLASSLTHVAGWESQSIDLSGALGMRVTAKIMVESA